MPLKRFALLISLVLFWLLLGSPDTASPALTCTASQRNAVRRRWAGGARVADDLTVCPDGPPACDYNVIQDAVDAAAPGDTIKVATGVYTDVNSYGGLAQVVYLSKTVTVRGGYGLDFIDPTDPVANPTTLDALGGGRVLYITGDISPTVEGLRMTGGDATGLGGSGGGVYIIDATVTISRNRVFSNITAVGGYNRGGGLFALRSNLILEGNTVSGNTASWRGGGLWLEASDATLNDNTISTNAGYQGGGLGLYAGDVTLNDNTISTNTATNLGGGLYIREIDATLIGNTISNNTSGWQGGGGMIMLLSNATLIGNTVSGNSNKGLEIVFSNATLDSNTIISNTADGNGGGLRLEDSVIVLNNNFVAANTAGSSGGGLVVQECDAVLSGNTFFANTASSSCGGLTVQQDSNATLDGNTIISNTTDGSGGGLCLRDNSGVTLSGNVVATNAASQGSGLHIREDSPRLLHNTIARNSGGDGVGIYVDWDDYSSTVWLTNTILVSQTVGVYVADGNTAILDGTLWGNETDWVGNVVRTHDYWGDPDFLDPDTGDYHIGLDSIALGRGVDAGVTTDIDDQLRPMDWGYDLGADEYPGAGLALAKPVFAANRGQTFTYTISVTSVGLGNATSVALTDTLDLWQRPIAAVSSQGSAVIDPRWGGSVVGTLGDLVTGTVVYVTITAEVSAGVPLRQPMTGALVTRANETTNSLQVTLYAQNCHARLNDAPAEYITLQAAVDAASPGDLVKVAGLCLGVGRRENQVQQAYLDKSLAVRGGYTTTNWLDPDPEANPTTLDGLGMGRVLYIEGSEVNLSLEGLRITGGDVIGLLNRDWKDQVGGGVYASDATVTISHCQVFSNTANSGGGLWLERGTSLLWDNLISNNSARYTATNEGSGGKGGGLYLGPDSDVTLGENVIMSNTVNLEGGGLCSWLSDVTLDENTISANTASDYGGGMHFFYSSVTLTDNTLATNAAEQEGGGLNLWGGNAFLTGNVFVSNTVRHIGGGLNSVWGSLDFNDNVFSANTADNYGGGLSLIVSDATLINNLITGNQAYDKGSGLWIDESSVHLLHNTIARNSGGDSSGVYLYYWDGPSTVTFTNTILVSHAVGVYAEAGNEAILESTLWGNETDWAGPGTIDRAHDYWGDPAFLDPAAGDYHIGPSSMALDRGIDAGVTVDIDGAPRPLGPGFDLGADEAPAAAPGRPILLAPPDGTVTTTQGITLAWQAGAGSPPTGYNLDLDGGIVTTTDTSSTTLLSLGVHTWTVRAFNQVGYSDWAAPWTVEVTETLPPPNTPVLLAPPDGTITTTQTITLAWQAGSGAAPIGYNLDLDGTVVTTTGTTSSTLLSLGVHTWTVQAFNAAGYSDWALPWTVEIQPNQAPYVPSNPAPADGAAGVPSTATLGWQGGDPDGDPVTYTVAFGTSDPPPVVAQVSTTSYDPGPLAYATTYHWAITASDGLSTTGGPAWSFTTALTPCVPVTDVALAQATPGTVYAGDVVTFSADLAPDDLTLPYTYTVHIDGMSLVYPQAGTIDPLVFSHTFPVSGNYTVEVAVWNCGLGQAGAVADTLAVEVVEQVGYWIYLPVVMKEK